MSECDERVLSAYVDGELDAVGRHHVEQHLRQCTGCAEEIRFLREMSHMLKGYAFDDIDPHELAGAHDAVERAADQPVLRLGFTLGVIAASVLIVSCAWLLELPRETAAPRSPTQIVAGPSAAPAWERMATTLKAEPFRSMNGETAQINDSRLADWMLNGLSGKNTHEEEAN